jgi:hypothetical protein
VHLVLAIKYEITEFSESNHANAIHPAFKFLSIRSRSLFARDMAAVLEDIA